MSDSQALFGPTAKSAVYINRDFPELPNEAELLQELRLKLGPHADETVLIHHIRASRGKLHWAVNRYFREALTGPGVPYARLDYEFKPAAPTQPHQQDTDNAGAGSNIAPGCQGTTDGGDVSLDVFPVSVIEEICKHLNVRSLCQLSQVSRTCRKAAASDGPWARLFCSRWGQHQFPIPSSTANPPGRLPNNPHTHHSATPAAPVPAAPPAAPPPHRHHQTTIPLHTHPPHPNQHTASLPPPWPPHQPHQTLHTIAPSQLPSLSSSPPLPPPPGASSSNSLPLPAHHHPFHSPNNSTHIPTVQPPTPPATAPPSLTASSAPAHTHTVTQSSALSSSPPRFALSHPASNPSATQPQSAPAATTTTTTTTTTKSNNGNNNTGNGSTSTSGSSTSTSGRTSREASLPAGPSAAALQPSPISWQQRYRVQSEYEATMSCPCCSGQRIVPIVYGFPSTQLLQGMQQGRLVLGGDHLIEDCHVWACTACNASYRYFPFRNVQLWVNERERQRERQGTGADGHRAYTYEL